MSNKSLSTRQVNKITREFIKSLEKDKRIINDVYIYGSYAKKRANADSDIDICIVSDQIKDTSSFNVYLNKKAARFGNEYNGYISPIGFKKKDFDSMVIPLVYEIKTTGKKIKL